MDINRRLVKYILLCISFSFHTCFATVYFADNRNGNKAFNGLSPNKAFSTIQDCVDALKEAGDECRIRAGRYHEDVTITGKHGSKGKPFVIAGYQNERPIIDGTVVIKPAEGGIWKKYKKNIYSTVIDQDIWQLFVDGKMMTNARWPNALWSDYTVFNNTYWAKSDKSSKRGIMVNKGNSLAASGIDAKGAMAILNVGSFNTFTALVEDHQAGQNFFTYNDTFGAIHWKPKLNQYFLEDKLDFLDQPEEWFYDKVTKKLYLWTKDDDSPSHHVIRGKVQTYAFQITDSQYLVLKNIDFFATTVLALTKSVDNYINHITFDSLNFNFPSYSKRMLAVAAPAKWMKVKGYAKQRKTIRYGTFTFFNNTFYGSDGLALEYDGLSNTLKNNLWMYNDWSAANMVKSSGGLGTILANGIGDTFARNTMKYNGASAGYRPGLRPTLLLNHFIGQCWGLIQNDGSSVQVQIKAQTNALLQQNWVHSSPKYGLRFDGQPPRIGRGGTMMKNVVFKCNGLMVKGDFHKVYNNLVFDKKNDKSGDKQGAGCALCVLAYVRQNPVPINNNTVVEYNAADVANGGKHNTKVYPLKGKTVLYNVIEKVRPQLMDADNFDFRPREDSKYIAHNVGPYQYQQRLTHYWIPGRRLYKASTPVPPDETQTAKTTARDTLMWLNGYDAQVHHVFFGTNRTKVNAATITSPEYVDTVKDGANVVYLPKDKRVKAGSTYYWRVDAEVSPTVVYEGDVWSFSTKSSQTHV